MTVWMFPGQGSQQRGMGAALFARFPDRVAEADAMLGYSLARLCLDDPDGLLGRTDHTQPALFAVSAMEVLARRADGAPEPQALMGHSLGEYVALFAAGAFDFATGLKLVKERGRLMNEAPAGGMVAIARMERHAIENLIRSAGLDGLDLANLNAPDQTVLSGAKDLVTRSVEVFQQAGAVAIPLNVSAAFHSRLMRGVAESFARTLSDAAIAAPRLTVIANATARPYSADADAVRDLLARQVAGPVRWVESVQHLIAEGHDRFEEIGPGRVLTGLLARIRKAPLPAIAVDLVTAMPRGASASRFSAAALGSARFRADHGLDYAYMAGAMYRGIAGPDMVAALAEAGMMGSLGTGGMPIDTVRRQIETLKERLGTRRNWAVNLLCAPDDMESELTAVGSYLEAGVRTIEASAFLRLTPAVVRFRYAGGRRRADGGVDLPNRLIAKVSRPEVATAFLGTAPDDILDTLNARGLLTDEEVWCGRRAPVASDLSVEGDSGGHTDQGSPFSLIPTMRRLRDRMARSGIEPVRIGAAGGIGTPDAILAALMLGADYIVTGSINQCTNEAVTSEAVKDLLQTLEVHDFAYAPAGDMFELGARVQVVRRGTFFSGRANRLYDLYRSHDGLDAIPADIRRQIEERFFGRSLDDVWASTGAWLAASDPEALARAERTPKLKMALTFRWYFHHTTELALSGQSDQRVNFQIHSGPALGAFNSWARGGALEHWRDRHVANIALKLMEEAASLAALRLSEFAA
jgi:trans-AT polyketide synthase/acyltransferase/oxidoreductase domain-containing protein